MLIHFCPVKELENIMISDTCNKQVLALYKFCTFRAIKNTHRAGSCKTGSGLMMCAGGIQVEMKPQREIRSEMKGGLDGLAACVRLLYYAPLDQSERGKL